MNPETNKFEPLTEVPKAEAPKDEVKRSVRLVKGMTVDIEGAQYKVVTVRNDGKIVIRRLKS